MCLGSRTRIGLILLLFTFSFYSHAETWETIYKSIYEDSVISKSKFIEDGSFKRMEYIDSAMQQEACEEAKQHAKDVFERMQFSFERQYPDSKFKLVFGECYYDSQPREKIGGDSFWLKAKVVGEFQKTVSSVKNEEEQTPEKICEKKSPLSGRYPARKIDGDYFIYIDGCEYIAEDDIILCGEKDDNCYAKNWQPTGEVSCEGEEGYGRGNTSDKEIKDEKSDVQKNNESTTANTNDSNQKKDSTESHDVPFSIGSVVSASVEKNDNTSHTTNFDKTKAPKYSIQNTNRSSTGSSTGSSTTSKGDRSSNNDSSSFQIGSRGSGGDGKGKDHSNIYDHPKNSQPELDAPTAESIISPLQKVFPFLKDFNLHEQTAVCPLASFDIFGRYYVIDTHCTLFEKIRNLLSLFSMIIWSFLGLRIVLSA